MKIQNACNPEVSGRLPEACPEACLSILDSTAVPEGSGRFPEACSENYSKHDFIPHPEGLRKLVRKDSAKASLRVGTVSDASTKGGGLLNALVWHVKSRP